MFKLETAQPTGSFKDRAAALIVSMARQLGCEGVVLSSSGNAGAAVSAYAARAGLRALVLVPSSVPAGKLLQIRAHGAEVRLVEGTTATASGSPTSGANDLAG